MGKQVGDIALRMDDARIHLRNGYWNIPVRPSRWPNPLFPYYETLAEIEDEVQEKEGLKVTIASGEPMTGDKKPMSVAFWHKIGLNYVSFDIQSEEITE